METNPTSLAAALALADDDATETQDARRARMRANLADASAASAAAARALRRHIAALEASTDADAVPRLIAAVAAVDQVSRAVTRTTNLEAKLAGDLPPARGKRPAAATPDATPDATPGTTPGTTSGATRAATPAERRRTRENREIIQQAVMFACYGMPDQRQWTTMSRRALQSVAALSDAEILQAQPLVLVLRVCAAIGLTPEWRQFGSWQYAEPLARLQEAAARVAA